MRRLSNNTKNLGITLCVTLILFRPIGFAAEPATPPHHERRLHIWPDDDRTTAQALLKEECRSSLTKWFEANREINTAEIGNVLSINLIPEEGASAGTLLVDFFFPNTPHSQLVMERIEVVVTDQASAALACKAIKKAILTAFKTTLRAAK